MNKLKDISHIELTPDERERYGCHIALKEIGQKGQYKLNQAKVLVIGAGGLGSPSLLYLAAAGVGTIGVVEFDTVDFSNLQRQVLYSVEDVGKPKLNSAKNVLNKLNPNVNIHTYNAQLNAANALDIMSGYELIIDGTDNFATRYLINDACVILNIPFIYASVLGFSGQLSVFNYNNGPTYRCVFPDPPLPEDAPSCSDAGVLGVLPGIMGSLQATEAIKLILEIGNVTAGELLEVDALTLDFKRTKVYRDDTQTNITKLGTYTQYSATTEKVDVQEIIAEEFFKKVQQNIDFQLIDVREPIEYDVYNIGGEIIPQWKIENHIDDIDRKKMVIVHCQSGNRSKQVVAMLTQKYNFNNVYQLTGGLDAWKSFIQAN